MKARALIIGLVAVAAVVVTLSQQRRPEVAAQTQPASAQPAPRVPPPMFSPWYAESLSNIVDLEDKDVARLEQTLASNPDDFPIRLKLMAFYHWRAERYKQPEDRAILTRHILWLMEHHPDSEILHSYVSQPTPGQLSHAEYARAVALWDAASRAHPNDATVQWNAATFFSGLDQGLYLHYLEITAIANPDHPYAIRPLAHLYAGAMLEPGPLTRRAQAALEASQNRWVLGNAAYMLQSQYDAKIQRGEKDPRAAELAERYFLRAKAIDPNLDRNAILPQLDFAAIARSREADEQAARDWEARAEEGLRKIRRLPVAAFPELPRPIAATLSARGCTVPQPLPDGAPLNVLRGQFFQNGQSGWAVLCSVNNSTSLLAFRNDSDAHPETIMTSEDRGYLQGLADGGFGYSHQIFVVSHQDIARHFRVYGGPEPPPMDHQGIDDAFLEKASVRWYFHQGKWLKFPGAD